MMDLTGEVSSGALDMARDNLQRMLTLLVAPPAEGSDDQTTVLQQLALHNVTRELVRQVTSPHTMIREQVSIYFFLIIGIRFPKKWLSFKIMFHFEVPV